MKKFLFITLILLSATGCTKNEDEYEISKIYADNDFTWSQNNIKEKIIGSWEFEELNYRFSNQPWITKTASDLGDFKYLKVKADGTGELLGMEGVKWRMQGCDIIVTRNYLVGKSSDGYGEVVVPLGSGNGFGMKRSDAEEFIKSELKGATITTQSMDLVRLKVSEMLLNYFMLELNGKANDGMTGLNCKLRRR
jgi:hypothetical protein